jgi:hypothetical protein
MALSSPQQYDCESLTFLYRLIITKIELETRRRMLHPSFFLGKIRFALASLRCCANCNR